ncbi:MAG: rhodanese-like domain-containing protein [Candidatus Krumholzibacteria bacterium]|nr:rhodanese-like domain-containing protein [Candidatus Krumholzibacteria bacterium]
MNRLKSAILQAVAVAVLGGIVAFAHNAFSVNGIDPFRKVNDVPVIDEPGTEEQEGVRFITLDDVRAHIDQGGLLIDSRTEDEYVEGHIPGAVLVDYFEMGRYLDDVLPTLSQYQVIAIYCAGPDCEDSELLAREFFMMGFTKLLVYRGGIEQWEETGLPVEKGLK